MVPSRYVKSPQAFNICTYLPLMCHPASVTSRMQPGGLQAFLTGTGGPLLSLYVQGYTRILYPSITILFILQKINMKCLSVCLPFFCKGHNDLLACIFSQTLDVTSSDIHTRLNICNNEKPNCQVNQNDSELCKIQNCP